LAAIATVPLMVIALALAVPINSVLHIHSVGIVVLAETTLLTALVFPVAMGVLQGEQRFHALAVMYVAPLLLRLAALAIVAAAGAVFAAVAGAMAGTGLALWFIRDSLRGSAGARRPDLSSFLRYLGPVVVGLVGIALLTHIDILIVKARFSAHDAGAYGAASAF